MAEAADLGFPLKGSFKRTPFPTIVRLLAEAGATGNLYLLSGETKKVVFFDEGNPVFIRSNVLKECLGQVLAAEGLITQEQCDQTLEAIRRTGKKQGELLVEMGILSEGNLRYGLEAQLRHKLFDIFGWTGGKYQFKPGKTGNEHSLRFDVTPQELIAAGVMQAYSGQRAKSVLSSDLEQYVGKTEADPGFVADERHYWNCLDASKTVAELVGDDEESAVVLYALVASGCAALQSQPEESQPDPPRSDLEARDRPDAEFDPGYEPTTRITEYEDTPLPGQLPERPLGLSTEDDDVFAAVEDSKLLDISKVTSDHQVDPSLVSAEDDEVETFEDDEVEFVSDDDIEVLDDADLVEEDEPQGDLDPADSGRQKRTTGFMGSRQDFDEAGVSHSDLVHAEPGAPEPVAGDDEGLLGAEDDDLLDVDLADDLDDIDDDLALDADDSLSAGDDLLADEDLDDIDLGDEDEPDLGHSDATVQDADDPEVIAAMHFSEGEAALQMGDWTRAVEELEVAYEGGVDVAELHAMLAYSRFQESGHDPDMATHALELLEYAESLNPEVDVIFAYRGAVFWSLGDMDGARGALDRALQINPYCDVAMELMDQLGG